MDKHPSQVLLGAALAGLMTAGLAAVVTKPAQGAENGQQAKTDFIQAGNQCGNGCSNKCKGQGKPQATTDNKCGNGCNNKCKSKSPQSGKAAYFQG